LIERASQRLSLKRDGDRERVEIQLDLADERCSIVALDGALRKLAGLTPFGRGW